MSLKISSLKISASAAMVALIASLAVSVGAGPAAAAKRDRQAVTATHHADRFRAAERGRRRPPLVHRNAMPASDYNHLTEYDYNHPRPVPGYVFVPGKGVLGESCNMPTSTCTNEYRDVQ